MIVIDRFKRLCLTISEGVVIFQTKMKNKKTFLTHQPFCGSHIDINRKKQICNKYVFYPFLAKLL